MPLSTRLLQYAILLVVLLGTYSSARADSLTINFEGLADSTPVTTQYPGIIFSNATAITAGTTLNEFELPPHSGTNVVFDDGGQMIISFASPVQSFGGYFTYSVQLTLQGFDAADNLIGSATSTFSNNFAISGDPGSIPNEFISLSFVGGISRITISGLLDGDSFSLDDATVTQTVTTVPEPTTISLLLIGGVTLVSFNRRTNKH